MYLYTLCRSGQWWGYQNSTCNIIRTRICFILLSVPSYIQLSSTSRHYSDATHLEIFLNSEKSSNNEQMNVRHIKILPSCFCILHLFHIQNITNGGIQGSQNISVLHAVAADCFFHHWQNHVFTTIYATCCSLLTLNYSTVKELVEITIILPSVMNQFQV